MVSVLIAGAGPCGLLLANLLGAQGVECLLIEKRSTHPLWSRAIGITPPSLGILRMLSLDEALIQDGVCIRAVRVRDQHHLVGSLSFDRLSGNYPFILSLPQEQTMKHLKANLQHYPSVEIRTGVELTRFEQSNGQVTCRLHDHRGDHDETVVARLLVGCDGIESTVRGGLNCRTTQKHYPHEFVMGEAPDKTTWGDEAHLFFTRDGSVESFPLPGKRRRWVVLRPEDGEPDETIIIKQVEKIAGVKLGGDPLQSVSPFQPLRQLVSPFYRQSVVLCGDAAHVMSPIGGQGMNTGFGDAAHLARILPRILADAGAAETRLPSYEAIRKQAFREASRWAATGMWLGTRRGRATSAIRNGLMKHLLLKDPLRSYLATQFAMLRRPQTQAPLLSWSLPQDGAV